MELTLHEITAMTGGRLIQGNPENRINGISTDTRKIAPGNFYVALKGPRFNGHEFIVNAARGGALAALVDQSVEVPTQDFGLIQCAATGHGLGELARGWRCRFDLPVVAITGSCGKTSTKDILVQILEGLGPVCATRGNLNNLIGLPLTIFSLGRDHRYAVWEMGTNAPGEIGRLTEMAQPTIGLITNVGLAHLEGLGSVEGVARAKGELFAGLTPASIAVVNAEDPRITGLPTRAASLTYGFSDSSDVVLKSWQHTGSGMELSIVYGGLEEQFLVPLAGRHNALNVLAAVACCAALEIPAESLKQGLGRVCLTAMRGEEWIFRDGILVINDAYNANPTSILTVGRALAERFPDRRKIAVLGEMWELGDGVDQLHRDVGRGVAGLGFAALLGFGPHSNGYTEGFNEVGRGGMSFQTHRELTDYLLQIMEPKDVVLVKGSRVTKMEVVVEALKEQ